MKRLVIVGASGMVGNCALRHALNDFNVGHVLSIGRRTLGVSHPKLTEAFHADFEDCSALAMSLSDQDAVVYCLGTYTGVVSADNLRKITLEYTIEFARVFRQSSPQATFTFLSGNGADPSGRSLIAFARYKGAAEPNSTATTKHPMASALKTTARNGSAIDITMKRTSAHARIIKTTAPVAALPVKRAVLDSPLLAISFLTRPSKSSAGSY